MLRCTACRTELAPFALEQPEVERRCHRCWAVLTFSQSSQADILVYGPSLPPVPPGVSVQQRDGAASYREHAGRTLEIRWRRPLDSTAKAALGLSAGIAIVALVGLTFLGAPFLFFAVGALAGTALLSLAILRAIRRGGGVRVDGESIHVGRRGQRSVPRSAVGELWVVDDHVSGQEGGSSAIWMRSPDGEASRLVEDLPVGRVAHFVAVRLGRELDLQ